MIDNSEALIPFVGGESTAPRLQQSGVIDWITLASRPITFTIGVLDRLSVAGVDAYTVQVGLIIADLFVVSRDTLKRIEHVFHGLKAFGSMGNVLWFGFGVNSLIRSLVPTRQEVILLSLCAALGEAHRAELAAEVLYETVKLCGAPNIKVPSIARWLALVAACQGALSSSPFLLRVDKLMKIGLRSFLGTDKDSTKKRRPASKESLAECLWALGQVSRNELNSIDVFGGAEAGWLATVAEWILDLTVTIKSSNDEVLHTNCPVGREPQVRVEFSGRSGTSPSKDLSVGKVYRLQEWAEVIRSRRDDYRLGGRLDWEACLVLRSGKNEAGLYGLRQCLVRITKVAVMLSDSLARSTLSKDLLPQRHGLEYAYASLSLRTVFEMWNKSAPVPWWDMRLRRHASRIFGRSRTRRENSSVTRRHMP